MIDLIKAADALAEEIEIRLENGCEICNGDCGGANPPVQTCPQQRRTKLLSAYRQARESADGVKVKPVDAEKQGFFAYYSIGREAGILGPFDSAEEARRQAVMRSDEGGIYIKIIEGKEVP